MPLAQAIAAGLVCPVASFTDTGAIERANPLPVGTYWVDVFRKDWPAWGAWVSANTIPKWVTMIVVENHLSVLSPDESRIWVLFKVNVPGVVMWQGPGLPTIATADVRTSDDTVQKPSVSDMTLSELLGVKLPDVINTWTVPTVAIGLGALGLGYWYITRSH